MVNVLFNADNQSLPQAKTLYDPAYRTCALISEVVTGKIKVTQEVA